MVIKIRLWFWGPYWEGGQQERNPVEFHGCVETLCIYFGCSQVYTVVKIHQTEPLISVYFSVYWSHLTFKKRYLYCAHLLMYFCSVCPTTTFNNTEQEVHEAPSIKA